MDREVQFEQYLLNQIEGLKKRNQELELLIMEYERAIDASSSSKTLMEVAQDLIELKRAQNELKKERDYFKNVLDNSADAIGIVDAKGRFIRWNKRAEELFGFSFEELKGKSAFDLYEDKETLNKMLTELRTKGYVRDFEIGVKTKSGKFLPMGMSISVLKENGKVIGSVCVARDLTQIKQAQKELEKSKEAAEAASRAKSEFLANISHEIRTPMNAILGFAETLLSETVNERHRKFLETILASGRNLLALIDDILDLSKIEAGKLKLQPEPIDIKNVVYEMRSIFWDKAEKKGLEFKVDIDPNVSDILILDEVRIRQILMNLISNAIKFTDSGCVGISLTQKYKSPGKADVIIKVEDTGIGIPKSQHEVIFENFRQQDNQKTKKYGGTGLGLAITKKLVELMGGEISVESEVGKGSVFEVYLRDVEIGSISLDTVSSNIDKENHDIKFVGGSVLVVDDVSYNIEVIKNFLEDTGLIVTGSTNPKIAYDMLQYMDFDVVLMDIRMPEWDGISLTKKLRQKDKFKNIPIIAVTAISIKDRLNEINEHFDGYILKPIERYKLIETLKKFLKVQDNDIKTDFFKYINNIPCYFIDEINKSIGQKIHNIEGVIEFNEIYELAIKWNEIADKYKIKEAKNIGEALITGIKACDIVGIKGILEKIKKLIVESNW